MTVTDLPCPKSPRLDTHHLVPVMGTLTCAYCRKTARDITEMTPVLHRFTQDGLSSNCSVCHLDKTVHDHH